MSTVTLSLCVLDLDCHNMLLNHAFKLGFNNSSACHLPCCTDQICDFYHLLRNWPAFLLNTHKLKNISSSLRVNFLHINFLSSKNVFLINPSCILFYRQALKSNSVNFYTLHNVYILYFIIYFM